MGIGDSCTPLESPSNRARTGNVFSSRKGGGLQADWLMSRIYPRLRRKMIMTSYISQALTFPIIVRSPIAMRPTLALLRAILAVADPRSRDGSGPPLFSKKRAQQGSLSTPQGFHTDDSGQKGQGGTATAPFANGCRCPCT